MVLWIVPISSLPFEDSRSYSSLNCWLGLCPATVRRIVFLSAPSLAAVIFTLSRLRCPFDSFLIALDSAALSGLSTENWPEPYCGPRIYFQRWAVKEVGSVASSSSSSTSKVSLIPSLVTAIAVGRGLISLIEAMHKVKGTLIICGDGDLFEIVKKKIDDEHLEKKVKLLGYIQPLELKRYTKAAKIGLTLFEAKGLSNKYSMANRFFDYMHAGMPQLAMNYPEYQAFNKKYEVAKLLDDLDAFTIASSLNHLLKDENHYQYIRNKALEARKEFNWQNEEARLISVYQELFA